ncbi:hypothetical protein AB0425_17565 [Actinosynnema sp. NPDC051121]
MSGWLCLQDWEDRVAEIEWVLGHLDDLQADFLHIWGIDLDVDEPPPGWRFFAMCRRTFAYQGVMAGRLAEEDRRQGPRPVSHPATPAPPATRPGPAGTDVQEMSLEQLQRMHPDLIDR